jgi:hypothetical protein
MHTLIYAIKHCGLMYHPAGPGSFSVWSVLPETINNVFLIETHSIFPNSHFFRLPDTRAFAVN